MALHQIQRQQLIVSASELSQETAKDWYARMENLHYSTLVPALERQLDHISSDGKTISIERMEIQLDLDHLDQLEEQIAKALAEQQALATSQADQLLPHAATENSLQALIYFLQSGTLPWQAGDQDSWLNKLESDSPKWTAANWRLLFKTLAADFELGFFRLSQVQPFSQKQLLSKLKLKEEKFKIKITHSEKSQNEYFVKAALKQYLLKQGYLESPPERQFADNRPAKDSLATSHAAPKLSVGEAYYIANAGLVILHPYLNYLAEKTSCFLEDGSLNRPRFAGLLQYCISTEIPFREWEHPLTKLLLGLHPEEPLKAENPNAKEKAVVEDFLAGIIDHWSILGNTSTAGLREGFLQRPAKLSYDATGWQLVVEHSAHDLLLAHLPWSIGLIKSPWMTDLLQVDWA